MHLTNAMIDIVKDNVQELAQINPLPKTSLRPYPIEGTPLQQIQEFWQDKGHAQALIFSKKAIFDKTSNILRSDEEVFLRSPDIDVNGVGFDAYQDKKLIHIRSGVKIVIRQNARNHMDADQSKAPEQSEAAREFERMQSEILKETNLDQEETSK